MLYVFVYVFLIHMSNIWISVMSCVHLSSRLDSWLVFLHGKNFNVGHYSQTFQPAMLKSTIDFYHFISLSDLDLGWGPQG